MPNIHILTRDNCKTIRACLESASRVGGRIVVGDMGSRDGTAEIVREFGADLVRVDSGDDLSAVRNGLCSDGQNMYLEPWEKIVKGAETIGSMVGGRSFYVIGGGVVSKQVRLWEKGKFENPVFETVVGSDAVVDPRVVILADGQHDNRAVNTDACRVWADRRPTSPDPHYYLACSLLAEGRGREFMSEARKYLSLVSVGDESYVLMNYYLARQEFAFGEATQAYRRAAECLFRHPSFAEFWCLIGDMLFSRGQYERAMGMYENAGIAGAKRKSDDHFPIEISKYDAYPRLMEEKCRESMGASLLMAPKR